MIYRLSDICDYVKGKVDISKLDLCTYISTESMLPNKAGIIESSSLPNIKQTQIYCAGDVLVSNIRPYFKKIWYATYDGGCSNDVLVFRAKNGVSKRFLYYVLADDKFFSYSMLNSKGTKMPRGDKRAIMEYKVPKFSYEEQVKIAKILGDLDDKVAVNKTINRNLSEQAETLFKSWFEDYEPWNGEIPTDWKQGVLGDFVTIKRGGSPRPIQEYLSDEGLRWLKISDVSGVQSPYVLKIAEHIIKAGLKKTVYLEAGSLVLSNSATPGIPKILDVDSCIHDGWLYFPESQLSNYFLYLFYKSIRPKLVALGNGSVFTNLKTDILKEYSFSKPDNDTLYKFDEIVAPMFRMMREVARENQRLSELRDSVLPKLMSGELDVSDLDI